MPIYKETLGFDIDDVIADFWDAAIPVFNKKYNVEAKKSDFVTFESMNHIYGIEYPDFYKTIIDEGIFEQMRAYQGVPSVLQRIHEKGHKIVLITSRGFHPLARPLTEEFLNREDIPYHELHIKESGKKKSDYITDEMLCFADDLPLNLDDMRASEKVKKLALISQPWNMGNKDYVRYHGLDHFYRKHFQEDLKFSL